MNLTLVKDGAIAAAGLLLILIAVYSFLYNLLPVSQSSFRFISYILLSAVGICLLLSGGFSFLSRWNEHNQITDSPSVRSFLLKQIIPLRKMGFFQSYGDLTNDEIVSRLTEKLHDKKAAISMGIVIRDPVNIALLDPNRATHEDTEMDPLPGDGGYTELLDDLARISKGVFNPQNIRENLTDDRQHVDIQFTLNKNHNRFLAKYQDDWMDTGFVDYINELIKDSGRQFVVPKWGGQDYIVLCLDHKEQETLRRELKWAV